METLDRLSGYIGMALFGYALLAALLTAFSSVATRRQSILLQSLFVALSLLVMAFAGLPLIAYNLPLNPDEAQMIANAQKFATDMMTWRSVDSSTSGPLNSMVLMWPYLIGESASIPVARVTMVALAAATWLCTYFSLAGTRPAIRIGIMATFALFLAGAQFFDFTHFSSERLPAFLLAVATLVMVALANGYAGKRLPILLFIAGLALGATPFTKLQASPMGVVLGVGLAAQVLLLETTWRTRVERLAILVLGAVAVPAIILLPLAATEGLTDFWTSYIDWALRYVSTGMTSPVQFIRMITPDKLLAAFMLSASCLFLLGMVLRSGPDAAAPWRQHVGVLVLILLVATGVYAVVKPGRGFNHYVFLLVAPLATLAGAVWVSRGLTSRSSAWPTFIGAAIAIAALLFQGSYGLNSHYGRRLEVTGAESFFRSGDFLDWLPARPPRLLVWGWMPEWYVYSGFVPATRDVHTLNQMMSLKIDYFRSRFLSDFDPPATPVVVDGCAPESFWCKSRSDGLSKFPALDSVVRERYTVLSRSSEESPITYLRSDLVPELRKSLVTIGAITASSYLEGNATRFPPERVNDFSVFDTRHDHWLLPDGKQGWLEARFNNAEDVSEIWLLNTRNGFRGDRATQYASIDLLGDGKLVYRTRVELKRYPYWTKLKVSTHGIAADGVRITVLSFLGKGGGLNEIKLLTPFGARQQGAIDREIRSDW